MMRRLLIAAALLVGLSVPALAVSPAQGFCTVGNQRVFTAGLPSTTKVQASYPSCTVTVYLHGTVTLATIYSTSSSAPLANPFTANSDGSWRFYASETTYDVVISGGGLSSPFTTVIDIGGGSASGVNGQPITPSSVNAIVMADQASGATVTDQIANACATLGSSQGTIIISSSMSTGFPTDLPDNCRIIDLRGTGGPNESGSESTASFLKDILMRARWTTAPNAVQNYQTLGVFANPWSGGYNTTGGPKTNYATITALMAARTQGQHIGVSSNVYNWSNGDTQALSGVAISNGNMNDGGGEGVVALRGASEAGTTAFFTATVSGVSGSTISYSGASNEGTLADNLPVIILGSAYTTGTVSAISGTPPTVTGSGTSWSTQFGSGAHTNLFFCADWLASGSVPFCVPVTSVTDNTHLVLGLTQQNANQAWPSGAATTGNYHLYKGGIVTAVSTTLGSFTVSPASDFAVAQSLQQTEGWGQAAQGIYVTISRLFPELIGSSGIGVVNTGSVAINNGATFTGLFKHGIQFPNALSGFGVSFDAGVGSGNPVVQTAGGGATDVIRFLQTMRSDLTTATGIDYLRNGNYWLLGGSFSISPVTLNIATGSVAPQANVANYLYHNGQSQNVAAACTATTATCLSVDTDGVPIFRVNVAAPSVIFNSGYTSTWYSDNQSTVKAQIVGSTGAFKPSLYQSQTNCSSAGGTCSAAPAGSVTIAAGATTVTVATTAVTANSQILIQEDSSLGTKLSVTCNTTAGRTYAVTARTAATSFVITASGAPAATPACLSYFVVN